jgi:MFS transporter, PHS family, inorganic phosphate transporter
MDRLPESALPLTQTRTYGGNAAFHNFNNDYSHINDPNLRRRLALAEIDKVRRIFETLLHPILVYLRTYILT